MADVDVTREAKDVILKQMTRALGDDLFRRFGLDLPPIVGHLPGDLPVLEVRAQHADLLFNLADDTLVNFELQSDSAPDDALRFGDYNWAAFRKYGKRTHTIVLYGPRVTTRPAEIVDGGGHVFRMTVILLAEHDAETALARLQEKVRRGEPLTGVDRVDLLLLPLMRQSRPLVEMVAEALPLVNALPNEERPRTVGTIIGLAYHYLDESTATALLEAFKMANALEELIEEGIQRGIQEGIEQGRELGRALGILAGRAEGRAEGIAEGRAEGIAEGRAEGIAEGRAEGIAEGRAEGELEGERRAVRRLLQARFQHIPEAIEQRIRAASQEDLDQLIERAGTAISLDELL